MTSEPEWGSEERIMDMRVIIGQAVESMPDKEAASVLKKLMAAAAQDDLTLASTVRENIVHIGLALMVFGESMKRIKVKRRRGRPAKGNFADIDCRRAFMCWFAVRWYRETTGRDIEMTNREAIAVAEFLEFQASPPEPDPIFRSMTTGGTIEESVSRGKTKLGFSGPWTSKTCEEIFAA